MKNCILLLTTLILSQVYGQQKSYAFQSKTGTYTELAGSKKIPFYEFNKLSGFYQLKELKGETFKWYNILFPIDTVKTFHIQPNGNLPFDNDSTLIIVDAAFTYLDSINTESSVSYSIEGNAENHLIKTQYKNLKIRVGQAVNFVNFQIWVHQLSGIIEIHYGPSSGNNQSGYNTGSGPQVGMFFSRDDFSKCYEKLWVTGSPTSLTLDSNNNYAFNAMSGVPFEGTIFRFIPGFRTLKIYPEEKKEHLGIYPNPVREGLLFMTEPGDYSVYDNEGRLILQSKSCLSIELKDLSKGLYFIIDQLNRYASFTVE